MEVTFAASPEAVIEASKAGIELCGLLSLMYQTKQPKMEKTKVIYRLAMDEISSLQSHLLGYATKARELERPVNICDQIGMFLDLKTIQEISAKLTQKI
jgi:hypothetical protein